MKTVFSEPGTDYLFNACRRATELAAAEKETVRLVRCDLEIPVRPGDTALQVQNRYLATLRAGCALSQ